MNPKLANYLTPIVALFFATALGVTASSTIGTDISTGGNLDVTGNTTLTGTLGVLTASTTGAGTDISLSAADDLTLNAIGQTGQIIGNSILYNLYMSSGSGEQGYIQMDATGNDNATMFLQADSVYSDINLVSETSADAGLAKVVVYGGTTNASGAYMQVRNSAGGTVGLIDMGQTSIVLDAVGNTDEMTIGANSVTFGSNTEIYPPIGSAPPVACAAGKAGAIYYDSDLNEPCFCNGTDWKKFSDAATTCS